MNRYEFNVLGIENVLGHNVAIIDLIDEKRSKRVMLLKDFCNICAATIGLVGNIINKNNDIVLGRHIFNIIENKDLLNKLLDLNMISNAMIKRNNNGRMLVITRYGCEMIFEKLNVKTRKAKIFMEQKNLNNYFGEYK